MPIIRQEKSNVDFDHPCPNGVHKLYFTLSEMKCAKCNWTVPIANLICEHCGGKNRFARADLVPNAIGLVDIFECAYCNKISSIMNNEIQ